MFLPIITLAVIGKDCQTSNTQSIGAFDLDTKNILAKLVKNKVKKTVGIYFLFQDEKIVYVGQSQNVGSRVYVHLGEGKKEFDSCAVFECGYFTQSALNWLEARFILELNPKYNTTIPANRKYKTLSQIRKILHKQGVKVPSVWKLKKWIKKNDITPIGMEHYRISDFEGLTK